MRSSVLHRLPAHTSKLLDLKSSVTACFIEILLASKIWGEIDSIQICDRCFSCVIAYEKMAVFSCTIRIGLWRSRIWIFVINS